MDNSTKTNFFRPAIPASDDEKFNPNTKLNELSAKERETGIEELHGVSDVVKEDPAEVQDSLKSIREQLNLGNSAAVVDDTELLKFLRAERFDVDKAAIRFNRFAAFQGKLFGKQGKTKFSDLSDGDMKYLQSGFMQLLPQRDRAGRAILICIGSIKQQLKTAVETDLRCLSFLASKAAEDEETQKRGLVMVYYAIAQKAYDGRNNRPLHLLKAFVELPAKVVAAHFCFDSAAMKPLISFLGEHMESKMLCRFRSHCGGHVECQYNLMTFGIPKECLPMDVTGQVDLTNHKMFLRTVELQEQRMATIRNGQNTSNVDQQLAAETYTEGDKFLIPGYLDIILGRGQHAKNSPGHLRFKKALDKHQGQYEAAEKSQKTGVADLVLKLLTIRGCRFLKARPGGGWVQVSDDVGREKINHAFRNLRSTAKKNAASNTSASFSSPLQYPMLAISTSSSLSKKRALDEALDSGVYPFHMTMDFSAKKFFSI